MDSLGTVRARLAFFWLEILLKIKPNEKYENLKFCENLKILLEILLKSSQTKSMKISTRPNESNSKFDDKRSLTQAQNQLLTLIEAEMHQTENGANVNWLSEQLQRDIQSALRRLMDEGLVYDTIREEYLPHTKSRVTTQSPTPPNPHTPSPP